MIAALDQVETLTFFAEDMPATKAFYRSVFGLRPIFEDEVSAVFRLGRLQLNVLSSGEAPELVTPVSVATAGSGSRVMLTVKVDDADSVIAELEAHGVKLLNGPIDRPWGRRTAAFVDPAGNVWEIAQDLKA